MKYIALIPLLLVLATSAFANDAILRVSCQPQDAGSKVYINGVLKGECPVDIMLNAGPVALEVKKTLDAEYVQYFKQQFTVYAGVAKRIIVALSEPQLTPAAKKAREMAAMIQKKKEAKAQKIREITIFRRNKKAADAGDIRAMEALAKSYESGTGTKKNLTQARVWRQKAKTLKEAAAEQERLAKERADAERDLTSAEAGDVSAMGMMAKRYTNGMGVEKDEALAKEWKEKYQEANEKREQRIQQFKEKERQRAKQEERLRKRRAYLACTLFFIEDIDNDDVFEMLSTGIPGSWLGFASDLILTPGRFTYNMMHEKKLNAHAAVWARPDSMVAKAWRQQVTKQEIATR